MFESWLISIVNFISYIIMIAHQTIHCWVLFRRALFCCVVSSILYPLRYVNFDLYRQAKADNVLQFAIEYRRGE